MLSLAKTDLFILEFRMKMNANELKDKWRVRVKRTLNVVYALWTHSERKARALWTVSANVSASERMVSALWLHSERKKWESRTFQGLYCNQCVFMFFICNFGGKVVDGTCLITTSDNLVFKKYIDVIMLLFLNSCNSLFNTMWTLAIYTFFLFNPVLKIYVLYSFSIYMYLV